MTENKVQKTFFQHDDYRELLRSLYVQNKSLNKNFSYRFFARIAGFGSASFLKRVIDGESDLSEQSIEKLVKGFKMNREESHFFKHLVFLNQAKTTEEKGRHYKEIQRSRTYRKSYPLLETQMLYYTHWYFVVIREMVSLPHFQEDPQWIAANIAPAISVKQAQEALEALFKLDLLKRDETGRIVQTNNIVETPNQVSSALIAQFHREFMKKASESIDRFPKDQRNVSSVTFQVSKESYERVKEKIESFRKELLEETSFDPQPEAIFQLNLQIFPVTQLSKK